MNTILQTIFGLLGGLAIFIFGMNMMSECLQKVAGNRMKKILALLTKNPILGVIAGALTTAVLQSSSATTVMAIGFVSAGLMTLPQAISIILGANIGTTITAQIIAFKISDYIYIFVFLGFLVAFIAKSEKIKQIGSTVFAFGLLFIGIETMGGVMKPLASSPVFTDMIGKVADIPVLGVAVGTLMTVVVQSSSATIAVLQNFASQAAPDGSSILGLSGAIPILLGDNIGTTITALLACIGQSKNAKRTAAAHCIFNISGSLLFIWFVNPYAELIKLISPQGAETEVISRQIANAHTGFNLIMTIIWIPLIWLLVKIVTKIIPDGKNGKTAPYEPQFLDTKLISQPAAALQLVAKETIHFAEIIGALLGNVVKAAESDNKKQADAVIVEADQAVQLHGKIMDYLAEMFSAGVLTEEQATQTAGVMYVLNDIDRVCLLSKDIVGSLKERLEKKYKFSAEAAEGMTKELGMIAKMYSSAIELMKDRSPGAGTILSMRDEIVSLGLDMRKAHMGRVAEGKCSAALTAPFNSVLQSLDRMCTDCVNIAETVSGSVDFGYFMIDEKKDAADKSAVVMG